MNMKSTWAAAWVGLLLSGCGQTTEPPTDPGRILSMVQGLELNFGKALIGQRVAVTGHPMLCNLGHNFKKGELVDMEVHITMDCRSPRLAKAKIEIQAQDASIGFGSWGPKTRNVMQVDAGFSNESITFLTDDYKVIPAMGLVSVSGLVTYPSPGDRPPAVLEAVSLHTVAGAP